MATAAHTRLAACYFASLGFVMLCLGPALAHLLELPHKIALSRADYLVVQQIYRGWSLLGIVIAGALLSTAVLALLLRRWRNAFGLALAALLCLVAAQAVFWIFTYPTNAATLNWTELPETWRTLRARWEYSHAAGAGLTLAAAALLLLSLIAWARRPQAA